MFLLSEDEEKKAKKKKSADEEKIIASDFFYNYEDLVSRARITEESGLPENVMSLEYPFVRKTLTWFYLTTVRYWSTSEGIVMESIKKHEFYFNLRNIITPTCGLHNLQKAQSSGPHIFFHSEVSMNQI